MDGFHFEYMIDGKPMCMLHFWLPLDVMPANDQLVIMTQYIADFFLVLKMVTELSPEPKVDVKSMINDISAVSDRANVEALLRNLMNQQDKEEE